MVIASSDATHQGFVLACLEADKPVLCEKPLAPTSEASLSVVQAEAAIGRRLVQIAFMRRHDAGYVAMKQRLDAGRVGAALMVHCAHRNAGTPPGFTSEMLITSSATHEFDLTRWLLGQEVVAATVLVPRPSGLAPDGVRDPQLIVLETDEGVLVDVEVFVNARYGYDIRCELVGESGTLTLAPPASVEIRGEGADGREVDDDFRARFVDAYRVQLQAWVDGLARRARRRPERVGRLRGGRGRRRLHRLAAIGPADRGAAGPAARALRGRALGRGHALRRGRGSRAVRPSGAGWCSRGRSTARGFRCGGGSGRCPRRPVPWRGSGAGRCGWWTSSAGSRWSREIASSLNVPPIPSRVTNVCATSRSRCQGARGSMFCIAHRARRPFSSWRRRPLTGA